jgi:hypothetical protein
MNFNNRSDYLQGILNALNGLYYYLNDFNSTGILYYEVGDLYNVRIGENTYQCLMLNDEINVTTGIEEIIHTDMPEKSETDYTKADKTDMRINKTYLIVDKQNQKIESVVNNVTEQNNKISQITQTVDEINSKIQDTADITTYGESDRAEVELTDVNESEPIMIKVHPTSTNISYLYPSANLYPSDTQYIPNRIIRFTRTYEEDGTTKTENIDYLLPDDLLRYSDTVYDEFYLNYESQTCQVIKRCAYNADGTVRALGKEITTDYPYPTITLGEGNYTITLPGYDFGYLYVRLMAKNIYTTQFYTKAETDSRINQKANEINLGVNQTLTNYSTTNEMNSAIDVKANQITSSVSEAKNEAINSANASTDAKLQNYSTTSQMNSAITQKANEISARIDQIEDVTNEANGTKTVTLTNCVKGSVLELHIYGNNSVFQAMYPTNTLYPQDNLYPKGDSLITVKYANNTTKTYELGVTEVLRQNGDVKDEYVLEYGTAKVIRRINSNGTVKTEPTTQNLGEFSIALEEGTNTITIKNYSANIYAKYAIKSAYTDIFATQVQMNSSITQTAQEINSEVSKKVDSNEVISKINQSAEAVGINANKINLSANDVLNLISGNTINLSSKNILIKSDTSQIDGSGTKFYYNNNYVGKVGTDQITGDASKRGISIDLASNGYYIGFGLDRR